MGFWTNITLLITVLFLPLTAYGQKLEAEPEVEYFFSTREHVTIGVMGLESGGGIPQKQVDIIGDIIAEHISKLGDVCVVSKADIVSMLNLEKQKRLAGCTEKECFAEIAGALGMPWMVTGNVGVLGESIILNLKLIDVRNAYVVGRATRRIKGDVDDLLDELPGATEQLFDRVAERLGLQQPDRVTAAAKHPQPISESPSAAIVITRQEIEESGAITLVELLRRYPALTAIQHDPMYPAVSIRGTIRVLLLVDGREINLEFFVAPFFVALPAGIDSIERIEIVLGPNSALYGADAVAAVINVITRKPSREFHVDVGIAAGEHGTSVLAGSVQGGVGPVSGRLVLGIDDANSWVERAKPSKRLDRIEGTARLDLPDLELWLRGGLLVGSGRFFGVVGYFDFEEYVIPYAQVDLHIGDLKVQAHWTAIRAKYDFEIDLVHPNLGELGRLPHFSTDGDTFQVGIQYDLELFAGNLLICGLDTRLTSYRDENFVDPDLEEYRLGIFLHDEQRLRERVFLTLGVRFDYNSVTDAAISPRASIIYNPAGEHFLRLSGGMAFRKPTLLESSINIKVDANPAFPEIAELFEVYGTSDPGLSNEKLAMVEVGYHGTALDGSLKLRTDVYFGTSWDNIGFEKYVHFEDTPLGPRIVPERSRLGYDNVGKDDMIVGINAGAGWDPKDWLNLFLRGEFRHMWLTADNRRDPTAARVQVAAGGTLRTDFGLTLHLAAIYCDGNESSVRNPQSIIMPEIPAPTPNRLYLLSAARYTFKLGDSRVDLGLSWFNPFGGSFREQNGVRAPDGSNYGGELIGTRALFTARIRY